MIYKVLDIISDFFRDSCSGAMRFCDLFIRWYVCIEVIPKLWGSVMKWLVIYRKMSVGSTVVSHHFIKNFLVAEMAQSLKGRLTTKVKNEHLGVLVCDKNTSHAQIQRKNYTYKTLNFLHASFYLISVYHPSLSLSVYIYIYAYMYTYIYICIALSFSLYGEDKETKTRRSPSWDR